MKLPTTRGCLILKKNILFLEQWSTHTPGALRAIPLWFLNCLGKLTLFKTSFLPNTFNSVYPDHAKSLHKVVIALQSPKRLVNGGKVRIRKYILTMGMTLISTKRKLEMSIFVLHTQVNFLHLPELIWHIREENGSQVPRVTRSRDNGMIQPLWLCS